MADKVIQVNVTSTKSQRVSVSPGNVQNEISATPDSSLYYSNLAKNWAIGAGLILNEDYSSKHYAKESANSASSAKNYADASQVTYTNVQNVANEALTDIEDARVDAVDNITTVKSESIASVEAKGNEVVSAVNEGIANIEAKSNEANALVNTGIANINTARTEAVNAVTTTKNNAVTEINKEVTDGKKELNNIIEAGGLNINDKITNCLLEVPQRINLTLSNGTLTLKAGSVVIVPYGTTDKSAEYPVGSQFLNSNWKVVDTQFADNKFFVWAESQQDMSNRRTENNNQTRFISVYVKTTSGNAVINGAVSAVSGTTFKNQLGYNTSKNEVHWYNTDGSENPDILAFPIGIVSANGTEIFASIKQVFNGMGYIGQIFWVDKGVKGLIANGRNADGTYKNIEFKTNKMEVCSIHKDTGSARTIVLYWNGTELNKGIFSNVINDVMTSRFYQQEETPTKSDTQLWYKPSENIFYGYKNTGDWQQVYPVIFDTETICDGVLKNFNPKKTFRAVDYNELNDEVVVVTETYKNGTSWYRVWSPDSTGKKWCEQGFVVSEQAQSKQVAYNLLKTMADTNYSVQFTEITATQNNNQTKVYITSTTQIKIVTPSGGAIGSGCVVVQGYIA